MRAAAVVLGIVLAAASASGAATKPVDLHIPVDFSVSGGVMLAGHLDLPGGAVTNATFVGAREVRFEPGTLTVCPVTAAQDALPATIATILGGLNATCPQGEHFPDGQLALSPGTMLASVGTAPVAATSRASLASFAQRGGGLVLSDDGILLTRPGALFGMAPTSRADQVFVTTDKGTRTYNGTGYAFLHDGSAARFLAGGVAGTWGTVHVVVTPADLDALRQAYRPFDLLALESALRGPEAREPQGNVSGLLYEYGRVPAFINGAALGRLQGTANGVPLDGTAVALVRSDHLELQADGAHLVGTGEPRLVIASQGIAVEGGPPLGPPWFFGALLWSAAILVLAVRRETPVRPRLDRLVWWVATGLAFLAVDRLVMAAPLGTSALSALTDGSTAGTVFSLALFESIAVALSWLVLALPVRLMTSRTVRKHALVWQGAVGFAWLVVIALLPGAIFALAHSVARL
ncbi:MAG: hypothetical protein V4510_08995 [bacterium]